MKVRLVQGAKDLAAFIELPYRLHRADLNWVPPLRFDVRARLNRKKNPFFEHGEADYFLAERGGEVVGRIAAISNRLHNETHQDKVAFFGFFECVDDPSVAGKLFDTAAEWARERGFEVLRGPASFSTNDECGLLVEGFDEPPTLMMAHNPRYYVDLTETSGFVKAKDLWAYSQALSQEVPQHIARSCDVIRKRARVTVRRAARGRFAEEIQHLKHGYNDYWEKNWGFVPMTESELNHMARQLKPFYDPGMTLFAEREGRIVAVVLALPDLNEVLRGNRSGRLIPGLLKVFWRLRREKVTRMRLLMLGVVPEFRGKGVDGVVINELWKHVISRGITWCEAGWILEDNPAISNFTERLGFVRYKTYRLYDRALRVFVTGGTGFIGRHLVEALVARGDEVAALVRSPAKAGRLRELRVREVPGDLEAEEALRSGCEGRQVIYHVAGAIKARNETGFMRANEQGTAGLVRAAESAGRPRFVLVSSMAACGPSEPGRPLRGDESSKPVTAYGRSKLAAEAVVRESRLPWTILRPSLVYGPHDSEFLPVFKAARRGLGLVFGDGKQELSGIYGPDLVDALLAAALAETTVGRLYYACHPERFSSREFVLATGRAMGRAPKILSVPPVIARMALRFTGVMAALAGHATVLNGDKANEFLAPAWTGDPASLTRDTGWSAAHDLDRGIPLTATWYREAGWV